MFIIQKFLARKRLRRELLVQESLELRTEDEAEEETVEGEAVSSTAKQNSVDRNHLKKPTGSRRKLSRMRSLSCGSLEVINPEICDINNQLSDMERQGLRASWKHISTKYGARKTIDIMYAVFEKTLERDPAIRMIFVRSAFSRGLQNKDRSPAATVYDHGRKLAELMNVIIRPEESTSATQSPSYLGKWHASLSKVGFRADMWEWFGQSFADVMASQDVVRAAGGARAWNLVIAAITDRLRASYEQELRLMNSKETTIRHMEEPVRDESLPIRHFGSKRLLPNLPKALEDRLMIRRKSAIVTINEEEEEELRKNSNSSKFYELNIA